MTVAAGGHEFESGCDMVDVTSSCRPDTSWRFVDSQGHEHRWFDGDGPATSYSTTQLYSVPSLVWVVDGTRVDDDGEEFEVGHNECRECGQRIEPGRCPDTVRQYAPGLRWYVIDGKSVSKAEFEAAWRSASA